MAEYIDRMAVWKTACRGCTRHGDELGECFESEPCERLLAAFGMAPAADVAPVVHGRWINKTNHNRAVVEQRVDCSACGHIFWHTSAMSYNYCPNCGAKMDGGAGNGI